MLVRCWTRARWAIARISLDLGICRNREILKSRSFIHYRCSLCVPLMAVPVFLCLYYYYLPIIVRHQLLFVSRFCCRAKQRGSSTHTGAFVFWTPENTYTSCSRYYGVQMLLPYYYTVYSII
ncbi:hypothetical protein CI102_3355 [Trichoderma harzianum]|nr:hypothetical protein CI102_3355 [Trichoderma harzianum]